VLIAAATARPVFAGVITLAFTAGYAYADRAKVELLGVDAELLATLASQAVAPLLRAYADHLLPLLARIDDGTSQGAAWQQGYCPVCGAWPILAELRGVELARYLRCAACGRTGEMNIAVMRKASEASYKNSIADRASPSFTIFHGAFLSISALTSFAIRTTVFIVPLIATSSARSR